jgi:hypothetical protein
MAREDTEDERAIVRRILRDVAAPDLVELLGERLSGADLTSLLLEVVRRRASMLSPDRALQQYLSHPCVVDILAGRR